MFALSKDGKIYSFLSHNVPLKLVFKPLSNQQHASQVDILVHYISVLLPAFAGACTFYVLISYL
jgi:hypothetical protein